MEHLVHPVLVILTGFVVLSYGFIYIHARYVDREEEPPSLIEPVGLLVFFAFLQGLIHLL